MELPPKEAMKMMTPLAESISGQVTEEGRVILPKGYHKLTHAYIGVESNETQRVVVSWDTGSFRNAVNKKFYEATKGKALEKIPVEATVVQGVTEGMETTYDEAAVYEMTFMESQGRKATAKFLFVIMENLSTDFIIGAPTSDNLGVQVWKGGLTLHKYNLDLQGVRGRTSKDAYIGELYEPRIVKDRDIMVEWLK